MNEPTIGQLFRWFITGSFFKQKRCPHGNTSWYLCIHGKNSCKKEHPEWAPFEGEGPYIPNIYE